MSSQEEARSWSTLHDLALIFLYLAHGADADLEDTEIQMMSDKLRDWHPRSEVSDVGRIMQEVMLVYMGAFSTDMLHTSVASVREDMPKPLRISVLNDLADMASADGMLAGGEVSFIQQLARAWEVESDIRRAY